MICHFVLNNSPAANSPAAVIYTLIQLAHVHVQGVSEAASIPEHLAIDRFTEDFATLWSP